MLLRSQLALAQSSKKFEMIHETFESQMLRLNKLKNESPRKAVAIMQLNETLVSLAESGELQKFVTLVSECDEEMLLFYFIVKMYKGSLLGGYFMITKYMLDMGYPVNKATLPDVLHECLYEVDDYRGSEIVEFLYTNKCDLSKQQKVSYLSPLHIAVRRDMVATVSSLVRLGSDIDSVAKEDLLPLAIAKTVNLQSAQTEAIIKILEAQGARITWRRDGNGDDAASKVTSFVCNSDTYTSLYTQSSTKNFSKFSISSSSPPEPVESAGKIVKAAGFAGGRGFSLHDNPAFVTMVTFTRDDSAAGLSGESEDGSAFLFSTG